MDVVETDKERSMIKTMKPEGWQVTFKGDLSVSETWQFFNTLEEAVECAKNPPIGAVAVTIDSL